MAKFRGSIVLTSTDLGLNAISLPPQQLVSGTVVDFANQAAGIQDVVVHLVFPSGPVAIFARLISAADRTTPISEWFELGEFQKSDVGVLDFPDNRARALKTWPYAQFSLLNRGQQSVSATLTIAFGSSNTA